MDTKQIDKELTPNFNAQVYYDPQTGGLFTVKRTEVERIVISGMCGYYDDAITDLMRYAISHKYFCKCEKVNKDSPKLIKDDSTNSFKIRGYDPIHNDYIFHNVYSNPEFTYLPETDELVKANMKRYPMPVY